MSWGQTHRGPRKLIGRTANLPTEQRISFELSEYWLRKHQKRTIEERIITVRCQGGKMHRIHMRFPGHITLLGHMDKRAEQMMMKLGGAKPYCLQFLESWKEMPHTVSVGRPAVLRFLQARQDLQTKKGGDRSRFKDTLGGSLEYRIMRRAERVYTSLMSKIEKQAKRFGRKVSRTGYSYSFSKEEEDDAIRPIIKFTVVDLINKPKEEVNESHN